ncbi:MAG: ATP-grasp domain-containing protein [Desulfobacteraceae bacterium]|nr:ATP-grasp domain-containing protein [Desulfobacteraceae bacterium]
MMSLAVSGLAAVDNPAPGVAVIRCLREEGFAGTIIGLAYDVLEPGILNREIVDAAYLLPYPKAGKEPLWERLLHIHERHRLAAIIPCLDSELTNFIGLRREMATRSIACILPTSAQLKAISKSRLAAQLASLGVATPETRFASGPGDVRRILEEMALPVFIKGPFYEAYKAHSVGEGVHLAAVVAGRWGYPVIVQQGVDGEEINAALVSDGEGGCAAICMKKLVITGKGKGWTGVSIRNEGLLAIARTISAGTGWRGPMEIEAVEGRDGAISVIEINPRFPAWIYLSKAAGLNLPHLLLQMIQGQPLPAGGEYRTGVVFSNFTTNIITEIATIEGLFTAGEVHYEKEV